MTLSGAKSPNHASRTGLEELVLRAPAYWHIARLMKVTVWHWRGDRAAEIDPGRAFLRRGEVHALAGHIAVLSGKLLGRGEAVGRAVRRDDAFLAAAHHPGARQLGHRRRPRPWWHRRRSCRPRPPCRPRSGCWSRPRRPDRPSCAWRLQCSRKLWRPVEPAADELEHAGLLCSAREPAAGRPAPAPGPRRAATASADDRRGDARAGSSAEV